MEPIEKITAIVKQQVRNIRATTSNSETSLCVSSNDSAQRGLEVRNRFGSDQQFLTKVSPDVQYAFAAKPEAAVMGNYPTLADINAAYGKTFASEWLIPQLYDLSSFTGAKNFTEKQQEQLARTISVEYQRLKVTELMLFFHRFKAGHYGRFYGTVDPMVIMGALRDFIKEREDIRNRAAEKEAVALWEKYKQSWPQCAKEINDRLGLTGGDIWLNVADPYRHTIRVCIGSKEVLNRFDDADVMRIFMDIVHRYYGEDITVTYRKTWNN